MVEQKLDTGDYSLVGYEDILSIERKRNFSELWGNLAEKDRIEDEMSRMADIKYAYMIIETNLTLDHFDLSPPQYTKGVPGKALIKWIVSLGIKYGVHIMPHLSIQREFQVKL
jgi:hypothetical protein